MTFLLMFSCFDKNCHKSHKKLNICELIKINQLSYKIFGKTYWNIGKKKTNNKLHHKSCGNSTSMSDGERVVNSWCV